MTSSELENLVRIGKLKREAPSRSEFDGLVRSGQARLTDAANESLSRDSRFDLAGGLESLIDTVFDLTYGGSTPAGPG